MTTKIPARQRHEEIKFENMVISQDEQTISTPDIWKTRIRVVARTADGNIDISGMCDGLSWSDQSSDSLANINVQAAMSGSITLKKPALRNYRNLASVFSARVVKGVDRWGALGVVIVAQVGYGKKYTSIWAMRVTPGYGSSTSESISLASGDWTLNLTDDLWTIAQTVADFKYTKGKVIRKNGWRCDQIAHDVCQRYRIPVRTLSQGTTFFALAASDTALKSPVDVITAAYNEETKRTGRTFIVRWGAPDAKHPFGALEVIPMRRNRNLYRLRQQLLDATLTRSQQTGFATIILARGQIKQRKGKTRKVTATVRSDPAIHRFGFVRKTIDFGTVNSETELRIMAQRSLAQRLTPIRTAELNHPGIASIRRGDAVHINIPEEGYSDAILTALQTPSQKHKPKYLVAALQAAEKADPSLYGLPDPTAAAAAASQSTSTTPAADANTPAITPVANQGIAFVTSASHSVSSGSYTMDLSTQFIDVLDPREIRAEVDKTIRDWKKANPPSSAKKKAKKK